MTDDNKQCGVVKATDGAKCENPGKHSDGKCGMHTDETGGVGRPSKFERCKEDLLKAAKDGLSKKECAERAGVSEPTFHRYLNERPEFRDEFHEAYSWSRSEWAKENDIGAPSGEDHPLWIEGNRSHRGPNWVVQRRKCLERDGYECRSCGTTDEEHQDRLGYGLHVHHIVARSNFTDDDPAQNELSNLVTLCHQCHEIYEGTQLSPVEGVTP